MYEFPYCSFWVLSMESDFHVSQTQQNTERLELRSCVQNCGLTAGTVRWHLYYFTWRVLEDCTSICFCSLLLLQAYRTQPTSAVWWRSTYLFRGLEYLKVHSNVLYGGNGECCCVLSVYGNLFDSVDAYQIVELNEGREKMWTTG